MKLEALRAQLDEVDDQLLQVLARRAALVAAIWRFKERNGVPRIDEAREAALRERLLRRAETLGLSRDAVSAVLNQLVGKSLR